MAQREVELAEVHLQTREPQLLLRDEPRVARKLDNQQSQAQTTRKLYNQQIQAEPREQAQVEPQAIRKLDSQ